MPSQAGRDEHRRAWRTSRPLRTSSSSALSSIAESDPASSSTREQLVVLEPSSRPRARIQLTLPWMVLISPLWQRSRNGCARSHDGVVFVEKRWWKIGERDGQRGIHEIGVERAELVGRAERLVGDGAEGQRADVGAGVALGPLAGAVGAALGLLEGRAERAAEDELLDPWRARLGGLTERLRDDRDRIASQDLDPLGRAGQLDRLPRRLVPKEHHRQPAPGRRDEGPRDGQEQAGAVAGPAVGGDGATMAHAAERLEREVDELPARAAAGVGDEPDPAGSSLRIDLGFPGLSRPRAPEWAATRPDGARPSVP